MVKIIRKWKRILLFKGYMRWQTAVEQIIRTRNFVVATLRRWRHNELGVAWTSWSDYIEMQRRCVTIIKKVVHRWTHRTMGAAVDQWKVQMKISLTRATLIRAAIGRMKTPAWRSFARWHEAARQLVHIKYTCSKVVLRWRSGLYCKVIGTWLKRVRDRRSMRNKAITVLRKWALAQQRTNLAVDSQAQEHALRRPDPRRKVRHTQEFAQLHGYASCLLSSPHDFRSCNPKEA